ncbi:Cytochrome b5 [Ascosphaera apis ARSEF 7405]|uniref:Cytochrome b5 n=1 Tax=Ascosphaera apis ARSEF 7405 TaxID=392613 RepID=A0A167V2C6_9EURO|nr:Cytochrome b5 [Ascosphaera apis ARSEF 7405]
MEENTPLAARAADYSFVSPINVVLLALLAFVIYMQICPRPALAIPKSDPPKVYRVFTPTTLQPYNGQNGAPVYLAVKGKVYDVTSGRNFYGPGGPYANFAGRDATRGLACQSFDEEMLTKDLTGPLDDLKDLNAEQLDNLAGWEERFESKYLVVGKLVPQGDPEAPNN